ncbi:spore photoproduct lyase family protein [uncultured Candidatus Kuenenia sp.]|uniref:SPL family radical SAM protein n=1 Tax=uncultured Candidatus Kuenenia sp. TaxID=1048336 RepID=UPI0003074F68|nr:hypothetical protein [uncultured Candidatus Kuenenia sp.]MCF6153245.1 hypothetical protein [Candidatus Kuenenia stuttgartiensis]
MLNDALNEDKDTAVGLIIKEPSVSYKTKEYRHSLVSEIRAIRGKCDSYSAEKIAERAHLPLKWLDQAPSMNGEKGAEKLRRERGVLLLKNRTSPFIEQFQHPIGRCAKFYKLTAYNNCNFWCEYCYLYLTFRTMPVSTHFVNYEKMFREIVSFDRANIPDTLRILNLGELCDPLAIEDITRFAEELIPFVAKETQKTRLLFLTKSDNVNSLLNINHNNKTIVSFSVNTDIIHQQLEHRTPAPEARLAAAKKLQEHGYEIRLRIDPVIWYSTWKRDYLELVQKIFSYVKPVRITIGEYRPSKGLATHIGSRFPESSLLKVTSGLISDGTKLRYPEEYRISMFSTISNTIKKYDSNIKMALCKEDVKIWKDLGMPVNGLYCNCLE